MYKKYCYFFMLASAFAGLEDVRNVLDNTTHEGKSITLGVLEKGWFSTRTNSESKQLYGAWYSNSIKALPLFILSKEPKLTQEEFVAKFDQLTTNYASDVQKVLVSFEFFKEEDKVSYVNLISKTIASVRKGLTKEKSGMSARTMFDANQRAYAYSVLSYVFQSEDFLYSGDKFKYNDAATAYRTEMGKLMLALDERCKKADVAFAKDYSSLMDRDAIVAVQAQPLAVENPGFFARFSCCGGSGVKTSQPSLAQEMVPVSNEPVNVTPVVVPA